MLKDGNGTGPGSFLPARWGVVEGEDDYAVYHDPSIGPTFGGGFDLNINWNGSTTTTFVSLTETYDIPDGSRFSTITGRPVVEIEVFGVCSTTPALEPEPECRSAAGVDAPTRFGAAATDARDEREDIHEFGSLVAGSLMKERLALRDDEIDLLQAGAKVAAAADAFAAVYGPDAATGKEDPVVELNVRGSRVTTLLSTLQVCPDSALAARFDKEKWPATEDEVDQEGRRMIDCRPSVFAKVLDVLRVRKRAAWARGTTAQQPGRELVRVIIMAADRETRSKSLLNKYVPGDLRSFVMDCVDTTKGSSSDTHVETR